MLKPVSLLLSGLLLTATAVQAQTHAHGSGAFEERILNLEKGQAEIYHTLQGQKEAGLASRIAERVTLSGLLEVEAAAERLRSDGNTDSASDLTLATAYLAFGAKANENFSADLSFLYEEGETDLEVDEATINYSRGPWSARAGQQYLPFGVFYSHFISDPLTLDLGETRATALLAGFENDLFALSGFVFNGRADRITGESHIEDWGASLIVTPLEGLSFGASYLSDLADTDAELLAEDDNEWTRRVAAWSAFAIYEFGNFDIAAEYLGATRAFGPGAYEGLKPEAWNIEAGYDVRENVEVAVRYEGSREFVEQPKNQYGAAVSWSPRDQVSLSLEYLRGKFENDDKRDLVTAQLALEF